MKIKIICLILLTELLMSCATTGDSGLKSATPQEIELITDKQKADYATGFEQIKALINDNTTLDRQAYLLGINDAMDNLNPRLATSEMDKVLDWQALAKANLQVVKKATLTVGQAFLVKNKSKADIKTLASGLQYKIITEGKGTLRPKITDTTLIHFRLSRIDGKELTEDALTGKIVREARLAKLPKGLQEALQLMTEGSNWQLFIPSDLAYGEHGVLASGIMPNETLVCDIDLLHIAPVTGEKAGNPSLVP
jgi:FKBP-type peptidyl-prolyl cis-trans isomerase